MNYRARVYNQGRLLAIVDRAINADAVARVLGLPRSALCNCGRPECYSVQVTPPDAETSR
jgi:hypothetical protein